MTGQATTLTAAINFGPPHYPRTGDRAVELWGEAERRGATLGFAAELHDPAIAALHRAYPHLRVIGGDVNSYRNARGRLVGRHARTALLVDTRPWTVHDHTQIVVRAPVRKLHLPAARLQWDATDARLDAAAVHLVSGRRRHPVRVRNTRTLRTEFAGLRTLDAGVMLPGVLGGDWNDRELPDGLPEVRHGIDAVVAVGEGATLRRHPDSPLDTTRPRQGHPLGLDDHEVVLAWLTLAPPAPAALGANEYRRAA